MIEQFTDAMKQEGITPPANIQPDGTLRRFHVEGDKPRSENGWCVLHDNPPAGAFGDWRQGISETWSGKGYQSLTNGEKARYRANMEAQKQQREVEQARVQEDARQKAADIWNRSEPAAEDHPYLVKKGIKPHGLHQYKGALVVPVYSVGGELVGLQFINSDGSKKFLTGTQKKGSFAMIGNKSEKVLCLAEGASTAVTLHEATGHPVAVCFDAGNLQAVAEQLREKYPETKLLLCADNDRFTDGNPGLTKATQAAEAVGGACWLYRASQRVQPERTLTTWRRLVDWRRSNGRLGRQHPPARINGHHLNH